MDTQVAHRGADFVAEEVTKELYLPVELNDEPYMLVEWNSEAIRRRHQYSFPPGTALLALLVPAAFFFFLMKMYGLLERKPKPAPDGMDDIDLEDALSAPSSISPFMLRSAVRQAAVEGVSDDVEGAQKATNKKKKAATTALQGLSDGDKKKYASAVKTLEELTAALTKLSDAVLNACWAMRGPLSDSQSAIAFSAAIELLRVESLSIAAERTVLRNLDDVEKALQTAGKASAQGKESRLLELGEWLTALRRQHRLLMDSTPVLLKTAAALFGELDLLH